MLLTSLGALDPHINSSLAAQYIVCIPDRGFPSAGYLDYIRSSHIQSVFLGELNGNVLEITKSTVMNRSEPFFTYLPRLSPHTVGSIQEKQKLPGGTTR